MWLLVLSSFALATPPEFRGDADHVSIANEAWAAATECAGWEAPSHAIVQITLTGPDPNGWAGHASIDWNGLYRIQLHEPTFVVDTLVHEVSHAWPSRRGMPAALTEGLTDLLAGCIRRRRPALRMRPIDEGFEYTPPSLAYWTNPDEALSETKHAGYAASYRLVLAASRIVGERALWPEDRKVQMDWPWFWNLIASKPFSDDHRRVLAAMGPEGGVVDVDGDGLAVGEEEELGTNPWIWDTDGDGWWDGTDLSGVGVPLPTGGTPICMGKASVDTVVTVTLTGALTDKVDLWARTRTHWLWLNADNRVSLPAGEVLHLVIAPNMPVFAAGGIRASIEPELEMSAYCPNPRPIFDLLEPEQHEMPVNLAEDPPIPPEWRHFVEDARVAGEECMGRPQSTPVAVGRSEATERRVLELVAGGWRVSFTPLGDAFLGLLADCMAGRMRLADLRLTGRELSDEELWVRALGRRTSLTELQQVLLDGKQRALLTDGDPVAAALFAFRQVGDMNVEDADDDGVPAFLEAALGLSDQTPHSASDGAPDALAGYVVQGVEPMLSRPGWHCSGIRKPTRFGWATFDAVDADGRVEIEIRAWDDDGRVVAGDLPRLIWSHDGVTDSSCTNGRHVSWIRRSNAVGSALSKELATADLGGTNGRRLVVLGGAETRVGKHAVFLSDRDLRWARDKGRTDVTLALIAVLGEYVDLGVQPTQAHVSDELALNIGYGVYEVHLATD